jgi:hypothetical protein
VGRTGKASTHKYIGPFRLQLGNRVIKAVVCSRDRLRESAVATRFIEVSPGGGNVNGSDRELNESSYSDDEQQAEFVSRFPARPGVGSNPDVAELQGSVEGPINPVNYSGTQINVWGGFPSPDLANFLAPKQPQTGFLTEQMIRVTIFNYN